ncbi:TPR-like protein [Auriscalpium vulgare]|uniref:TPR-like protein n=1 Tax=Auriscalpium vulgare TaxID=40419 RepID=A0ACB8R9C0_9AGAM|nr:TPR-like protein [Auriscalpium vulgare]
MGDLEHAVTAYENALRHNPMSIPGLTQVAGIARIKENYPMAVDYFQRVLNLQQDNGEIWSALGHCYLMQDDLQKAYSAYQHALYSLPNPKENPKLWYGIGILYDRYGSLDNAEEAFSSVLKMDQEFDKSNEVLFRLGIIYKQQTKYDDSLRCFDRILRNPPSPLANADIWFQIGHVYEQQGDHMRAREAYEHVVQENPAHAKVLQQLGWLYHQDGPNFQNQDVAIQYLTKSLEADPADAQSWYLLGRAYMAGQKYNKAYEAYQQAVYRDGRNPTFWCSIGVLYFQINQYRDALDAYSLWFDLGNAIDAYARAAELDPNNQAITQRLSLLRHSQATGAQLPAAPAPQDVHPTAYASAVAPPPGLGGLPLLLQPGPGSRPAFRADSRGPGGDHLPPPPMPMSATNASPAPFRGGPPPPVVIDESRRGPSHTPLAPMDGPGGYPPPPGREMPGRNMSLLLHPAPAPHEPEVMRGAPPHPRDPYYRRASRAPSAPPSPPPHAGRPRSPGPSPYQNYNQGGRPPVVPAQMGAHSRSPQVYPREPGPPVDRDPGWERREWERRPQRPGADYPPHQGSYYPPRGPSPPRRVHSPRSMMQDRTPPQTSPMSAHPQPPRGYWDARGPPPGPQHASPPPGSERGGLRAESLHPEREIMLDHRAGGRMYDSPAESSRMAARNNPPPPPFEGGRDDTPKPYADARGQPLNQPPPFKVAVGYSAKRNDSPEPGSSNGSASVTRSVQPSPTSAAPMPPVRALDEEYDEGVAETLMGLAAGGFHGSMSGPAHPPAPRPISRSPSVRSHRGSVSSTRSHHTPPGTLAGGSGPLKRPLSPADDGEASKRTKMEAPPAGRRGSSPMPSRPSPMPFHKQSTSTSRSPPQERTKHASYPSSPQLPAVLPPHPRPLGAGLSSAVALPPIATLSPASTAPSPPAREQERRTPEHGRSPSTSSPAPSRGKLSEMMNPTPPSAKIASTPSSNDN